MPGSLIGSRAVKRTDSTRSDQSDISVDSRGTAKKSVSFNKAVRIKKYPRRPSSDAEEAVLPATPSQEKKFWFRVYKNRRRARHPDLTSIASKTEPEMPTAYHPSYGGHRRLSTIDEGNPKSENDAAGMLGDERQHSSQQPADPPNVRRNLVKTIVDKFNEEAVLAERTSPEPVRRNAEEATKSPPRPRKARSGNPVVNGVKVIFGFNSLKKKQAKADAKAAKRAQKTPSETSKPPAAENGAKKLGSEYRLRTKSHSVSPARHRRNASPETKPKAIAEANMEIDYRNNPVEVWDSGDQLVSDTSRYEDSTSELPGGGHSRTSVQERSQVWKHETRKKYYEHSPEPGSRATRRKVKSYSDLRHEDEPHLHWRQATAEKGVSTAELHHARRSETSASPSPKTRDMGVQCNRRRSSSESKKAGGHRVLPSKDGCVSAFSDVPMLPPEDDTRSGSVSTRSKSYSYNDLDNIDALYSRVDKRSKAGSLQWSPSDRRPRPSSPVATSYTEIRRKEAKTLKSYKSRTQERDLVEDDEGIHLDGDHFDGDYFCGTKMEPPKSWVGDEDFKSDVELVNASSPARPEVSLSEASSEDSVDHAAAPASVMRQVDFKKQEISYENVPRQQFKARGAPTSGGTWFRKAEDDYRRGMAQTGNEPSIYESSRASVRNDDVRILVNGREELVAGSPSRARKKGGGSPSSVQSDSLYVRGGLAAAYQARQQKAAGLRRSNSSVTGGHWRGHRASPTRGSSAASAVSSSDSESNATRSRGQWRPVVMYIPGVSHHDRPAPDDTEDDRTSGISVARSQSMLSKKPAGHRKAAKQEDTEDIAELKDVGRKKPDLRRRHSMPKDTRFAWLKWKPTKPSRQP